MKYIVIPIVWIWTMMLLFVPSVSFGQSIIHDSIKKDKQLHKFIAKYIHASNAASDPSRLKELKSMFEQNADVWTAMYEEPKTQKAEDYADMLSSVVVPFASEKDIEPIFNSFTLGKKTILPDSSKDKGQSVYSIIMPYSTTLNWTLFNENGQWVVKKSKPRELEIYVKVTLTITNGKHNFKIANVGGKILAPQKNTINAEYRFQTASNISFQSEVLKNRSKDVKVDNMNYTGFALNYERKFSSKLGLYIGIGYGKTSFHTQIEKYQDSDKAKDPYGLDYIRQWTIANISENTSLSQIQFPIGMNMKVIDKANWKMCGKIAVGLAPTILLSAKSEWTANPTYTGLYPYYNITLSGISDKGYEFMKYNDIKGGQQVKTKHFSSFFQFTPSWEWNPKRSHTIRVGIPFSYHLGSFLPKNENTDPWLKFKDATSTALSPHYFSQISGRFVGLSLSYSFHF